ncbi:MAG: glycolate oxidase subunit GlcF [Sinobacteraceae bacterium]|nr:glycolate oxidase subunit GlcF [Nevskiaceae bacterium]MBV9317815.1 glycolate oxidase subunit GlcF [Gammaproteobacteria bacterium]
MQTALADFIRNSPAGDEADAILRSCVHCGFCLPACPTYQLLGDELDSPRGRIYLMKQLLEGEPVSARTQLHLDRCLTCRACESACPSGVRYGRLVDIGRALIEERVPRPLAARGRRYLLRKLVPYRHRVRPLLQLAAAVRPLLPRSLRAHVPVADARASAPPAPQRAFAWPSARHARQVVLLEGCVQPALAPGINPAAAQVLDRVGLSTIRVAAAGCCGALSHHLSAHAESRAQARRNIDALWPHIEAGAEAVVFAASACAAMVCDYGQLLRDDPAYADRAARVSALGRDIGQLLAAHAGALRAALAEASAAAGTRAPVRVAFHAPCTLQHALRASGIVEPLLQAAGFTLTTVADGGRCCGSAGTYSLLQPELATRLLRAKVSALEADAPELIATANIGCLAHLRNGTSLPVCHWVELMAARLDGG